MLWVHLCQDKQDYFNVYDIITGEQLVSFNTAQILLNLINQQQDDLDESLMDENEQNLNDWARLKLNIKGNFNFCIDRLSLVFSYPQSVENERKGG